MCLGGGGHGNMCASSFTRRLFQESTERALVERKELDIEGHATA